MLLVVLLAQSIAFRSLSFHTDSYAVFESEEIHYWQMEALVLKEFQVLSVSMTTQAPKPLASLYVRRNGEESRLSSLQIHYDDPLACRPEEKDSCSYIVHVHGKAQSHYYIGARLHEEKVILEKKDRSLQVAATGLTLGVPVQSSVTNTNYAYYSLVVSSGTMNVVVSPMGGNPSLYVLLTPSGTFTNPSTTQFTYSSVSQGIESVSINMNSVTVTSICGAGNPCTINIAVYGQSLTQANFSLVATQSNINTPTGLVANVPITDQIQSSTVTYNYYSFVSQTTATIRFGVTPLSGNPSLYVSSLQFPSSTNFQWSSAGIGFESVYANNCTLAPCNYYIAVNCAASNNNCSYSIIASPGGSFNYLYYGLPQSSALPLGLYDYYMFYVYSYMVNANMPIKISVTPLSGDPDMFITLDGSTPSNSNFQYISNYFAGPEFITLMPQSNLFQQYCNVTNSGAMTVCQVNVAVLAFSATQYSIQLSTQNTIIYMQENIPSYGSANSGQFSYYAFYGYNPNAALSFVLTPISGDPDMYISTQFTFPNATSATWSATSTGTDVVMIPPTDPNYVIPAYYFIGVKSFGFQNAAYSLTASTITGNFSTLLTDGIRQRAAVPYGGLRYFLLQTIPGMPYTQIEASATPVIGDVNLYVSINAPGTVNLQFPQLYCAFAVSSFCYRYAVSPGSYQYSSTNSLSAEEVTIPGTAFQSGAILTVAVLGTSSTNRYNVFDVVVTSSNTVQVLGVGQIANGNLPRGQYDYYAVILPSIMAPNDVLLTGTSQTGNIQIFADNNIQTPNATNGPAFSSQSWVDTLYIPFTSLSSTCQANVLNNNMTCVLFVGILGIQAVGNSYTFSAVYVNSPYTPTFLENGIPSWGLVQQGAYAYYQATIQLQIQVGYTITVTDLAGSTRLYVVLNPNGLASFYPITKPATFTGTNIGGQHIVQVNPPTPSSSTTTSSSTDDDVSTMIEISEENQHRIPNLERIRKERRLDGSVLTHLTFSSSNRQKSFVDYQSLKPVSLAASIKTSQDAKKELIGSTVNVEGRNVLEDGSIIDEDVKTEYGANQFASSAYCSNCDILMTVYGVQNSTFAITFVTNGDATTLDDGVPEVGYAPNGNASYYAYNLQTASTDIDLTFSLTVFSGYPVVYIMVYNPNQPWIVPTSSNAIWTLSSRQGGNIFIAHTDPNYCNQCTYLIAIIASGRLASTYSITGASSVLPVLTLTNGITTQNAVARGSYKFYQFTTANPPSSLPVSITVQALTGSVIYFITNNYILGTSTNTSLPTSNSAVTPLWKMNNGTITAYIGPGVPGFNTQMTTYTIGVLGLSLAGATFSIVAGTNTVNNLILSPGILSSTYTLNQGAGMNFQFLLGRLDKDIVITLTTISGDADLLLQSPCPAGVRAGSNIPSCQFPITSPIMPICTNYTWKSSHSQGDYLYISHGSPCSNANIASGCGQSTFCKGLWNIYVFGYTLTQFNVLFQFGGDHTTLSDGMPFASTTSNQPVCGSRDNLTLSCLPTSPSILEQISWFSFTTANDGIAIGSSILIQQMNGNVTGGGANNGLTALFVYLRGCQPTLCSANDQYPFSGLYDQMMIVNTDSNQLYVQDVGGCQGNEAGCNYFIGVVPYCGMNVLCANPITFQITFSTDTSVQIIPEDCFAPGRTCVLPADIIPGGGVKVYQANIGPFSYATAVRAVPCIGSLILYECGNNSISSSVCNPIIQPGPGNSDSFATVDPTNNNYAILRMAKMFGYFYVGVQTFGDPNPSYEILFRAGSAPILVANPNQAGLGVTLSTANGASQYSVIIPQAYLTYPAIAAIPISNATYTVAAIPLDGSVTLPPNAVNNSACGIQAMIAACNGLASSVTSFNLNTLYFNNLNPNVNYMFVGYVSCSDTCMPQGQDAQSIGFSPQVGTGGSFPPNIAPNYVGPLSAGGIFGIVLAAVVVVGVGGYFGNKQYQKHKRDTKFGSAEFATSSSADGINITDQPLTASTESTTSYAKLTDV